MFVCLISNAQQYQWTGASGNIDFFDELNWKDISNSEIPSNNSINPGEIIEFELFISCEVSAQNEIYLGESGKINILNGCGMMMKVWKVSAQGVQRIHQQ